MPTGLTLKPLLKPGVTDLVVTSAGRLSVRTFGRWTSGSKTAFRELFVLALDEIEPRALERFKAGERSLVKMLSAEQGSRLRAVVYESTNEAADRVIEIALRVIPEKIPSPGATLPGRVVETFSASERGLFLIGGGAGQGKSTLAATLVQEYLKRNRTRAVVLGELLEHYFQDDDLVTYQLLAPTVGEIERALWLSPSLVFTDKVWAVDCKNRLAQAATTQLIVSTVQAHDTISTLQAWLAADGISSDLFAHSLAGVLTVALEGDGTRFNPRYQVTLFGDEPGDGEFTLRTLLAQRDWNRLRRRLQDNGSSWNRRVA